MKLEELNEVTKKCINGEATVSEALLIACGALEALSRQNKEVRRIQGEMHETLKDMSQRMTRLEKHCGSPIWQLASDREEDEGTSDELGEEGG